MFVSSTSFLTLCWAQLCLRLAQHRLGFAHLAVISMVCSVFFVVFAIRLLHRFLCPILDPLAFVPNCFTRITFLYIWPFPKPWFTHMFWFKFNRGLNKNHVLASKPSFARSAVLHTQTVLYTKAMFYTKTMFLLGLCKRCLWLAG